MQGYREVRIIAVPYDSGHPDLRMGAGPGHLLGGGLGEALRSAGRMPDVVTVRHDGEPPAEVATAFELDGIVSEWVRQTLDEGGFPLVLSGNCNTAAIGTVSGAGPEDLGIVWFDAHGEFNTPETTTTGFIDGMGLAIAVGRCWKAMAAGVPGFSAVPEENVVMVGVRDADPAEQARLYASEVAVVGADAIERQGLRALAGALDELKARASRVYVHLDVDVLDARRAGRANQFAVGGGPDADELQAMLGMVRERFEVVAAGIASYDPTFDADGRVLRTAVASARSLTPRRGDDAPTTSGRQAGGGGSRTARQTVRLFADDGGAGEPLPVVFLHSTAGNASQWSAQLEHLRPARRAVALEWRGHGRTATPDDGDYSFPAMAGDVEEAVDRLGIGRFVLVAHSGGGLVAVQYAAERPERVAGLLLADPAGDMSRVPPEQVEPLLEGLASEAYAQTIEGYWDMLLVSSGGTVRERVMADLRATPKEAVVGFFRAQRDYDPLPALEGYAGPRLSVITPAGDAPFGLHNVDPELAHTPITGTGHWLQMDKPEEFNRRLDEFLVTTEGAGAR
jgi:arginase